MQNIFSKFLYILLFLFSSFKCNILSKINVQRKKPYMGLKIPWNNGRYLYNRYSGKAISAKGEGGGEGGWGVGFSSHDSHPLKATPKLQACRIFVVFHIILMRIVFVKAIDCVEDVIEPLTILNIRHSC